MWLCAQTLCLLLLVEAEAKTVVLFSAPHAANVRTHTNVGRALVAMGHVAYVCVPEYLLSESMVNVEGVHVIAYGDYLGNLEDSLFSQSVQWDKNSQQGLSYMLNFVYKLKLLVRQLLSDKVLIDKIRSVKPDLLLLTHFPPFKNFVILPYMLDVPFAFMSPFNDFFSQRVPFSISAAPCPLTTGYLDQGMSFLARLKTASCNVMLWMVEYLLVDDRLVQEFAPNRPPISVHELCLRMEVFLVESDHILDHARPQLPNVKFIGGTASISAKPLTGALKTFVESSTNGVAVVTFGSSIINIPEAVALKMASAFKNQGLNVIWRVNITSSDPSKMFVSSWIPQNDVLAHKNTRLFVSHCGANSQYEALYHGVPLLCLPLFGDQYYNAHRSTSKGYGLTADILEISDQQLSDLMKEVTLNETYKSSMKRASELFREQYRLPEQTAAYWIDHVMKYGGGYMRSAGQLMPLYQYLSLDILAVVTAVYGVAFLALASFCLCCLRLARRCREKKPTLERKKRE